MSTDEATIAHYEASVPYYTLAFDRSHSRHLDGFLDQLEPAAHILELGCGTGRDAVRMIERGFSVDPTDGTSAMVAKANSRHGINARLMRFDQLDAEDRYHAIWAQACLMHVSTAALPAIVSAVYRALRGTGLHYASFKQGEGEFRDDRGRLNSTVRPEFLQDMYEKCGFELLDLVPWQGKGADSIMRNWISLKVRKR